jgi:hypothetical protein
LAKKPKENWQIEVRAKLDSMGIGYRELSEFMNENEGSIRQVMCKDNQPILRSKICNYLNIEIENTENEQNQNL